ncbi:MAG TPA: TonB-dependent siderophore myxochelin receptor MxcH [Polyangiaceae bacterium]|nr:TonB-dependent siderophore myxochelin receptor MxcH [Polyangiaceae bacterium]
MAAALLGATCALPSHARAQVDRSAVSQSGTRAELPPSTASSEAARSAAAPSRRDSGSVKPPELITGAPPEYPLRAVQQPELATVVLRLTIDRAGVVTEAACVDSIGPEFDEAAREAALKFRFQPAERAGEAVASRILFPMHFRRPAGPPLASNSTSATPGMEPPQGARAPDPPLVVPVTSTPAARKDIEVTVYGQQSEAQRLRQSAEAVHVIETARAKRETADLGEVLARSQGVAIRRDGGLGSSTRFALNGMYDDQVRFFLDGVPLDVAGYAFGIANIPIAFVDRVEIYRGVVPIRLGADALGGAVNLITNRRYDTHASASYQTGSFGTHRLSLHGRYRHYPSGLVLGGEAFTDFAKNNYLVDVKVPDETGAQAAVRVPRFHDRYRAYGAVLEGGVVDRPWAKALLFRAFVSGYDKELQHNVIMSVPYGGVEYGERIYGLTGRYQASVGKNMELEIVGSYGHRTIEFSDDENWVYNWYGQRVRRRLVPGEIEAKARDTSVWQHSGFGRAIYKWQLSPRHALGASYTANWAHRTGDERIQVDPDARDPLTAARKLFTLVGGLDYQLSLFDDRLSNVVFVKDYLYHANTEEPLPGGVFRERTSDTHSWGVGDSMRFRFTPWLYAKMSYEYATRLPRPDEVFGNGVLVQANLELEPEVSHNANAGPRLELPKTPIGSLVVDLNGFLRDSDRLIVLLGNDRYFTYQNVYHAGGVGLESAVNWVVPRRWLSLDGTLTWQDQRNVSNTGTFKSFEGDRIPNRPYLFASWAARLRVQGLPGKRDTLEPYYYGRYVHGFYRGWESSGDPRFKQVVASQITHSLGMTWTVDRTEHKVTSTLEFENILDTRVFDNFGVQRPGRGVYLRVTADM